MTFDEVLEEARRQGVMILGLNTESSKLLFVPPLCLLKNEEGEVKVSQIGKPGRYHDSKVYAHHGSSTYTWKWFPLDQFESPNREF